MMLRNVGCGVCSLPLIVDFTIQRYYSPGTGRFLTADPYQAPAGVANPSSWNRYGVNTVDQTTTVQVTDPKSAVKKFDLDAFGNIVRVTDGSASWVTEYTYNFRSQLDGAPAAELHAAAAHLRAVRSISAASGAGSGSSSSR